MITVITFLESFNWSVNPYPFSSTDFLVLAILIGDLGQSMTGKL